VILGRALDMVGAPALNTNDRPAGTILSTALSVGWLQDILNLMAEQFPWAQAIKTATLVISAQAVPYPADFILDVRDGVYLMNSANPTVPNQRIRRLPYQQMLNRMVALPTAGVPTRYTVLPPNISFWRTPDITYTATLAYYARPSVETAGTIATFPDDVTLIEYVRFRALEWIRAVDPGSALKYAMGRIAAFRKAGLGYEPEDTTIPFDSDQFIQMGDLSATSWLGPLSNQ
jgi:hypothetical protein